MTKIKLIILIIFIILCILSIIFIKNNYKKENFNLKKDIIVYSPGGVGCSGLFNYILDKNNNINLNNISDKDKLKHKPKPINNITKKALYIMRLLR